MIPPQPFSAKYIAGKPHPLPFPCKPSANHHCSMRVDAVWGDRGYDHPKFDKPLPKDSNPWSSHHPFSNVLWIYFILQHLLESLEKNNQSGIIPSSHPLKRFKYKLDPSMEPSKGGFESARDVLNFALKEGWIEQDDIGNMSDRDK